MAIAITGNAFRRQRVNQPMLASFAPGKQRQRHSVLAMSPADDIVLSVAWPRRHYQACDMPAVMLISNKTIFRSTVMLMAHHRNGAVTTAGVMV